MNDLQAYLLAAGRGRRAGGPKAWRNHFNKTLLETQLEFLTQIVRAPNISVSIQLDWLPRCEQLNPHVRWAPVDPDDSPLGALQTLIDDSPALHWSYFYHVDMPVWERRLFGLLASGAVAAEQAGAEAVAPAYQGKKGHPVLLSPRAGKSIVSLDRKKDRLDAWLRSRKVTTIEVPYACIHENWNEPR